MTLVETTVLLSGRGQTTRFAALMNRVADPRDASVAADGLVLRVDEDHLVVLVDGSGCSAGRPGCERATSGRVAKNILFLARFFSSVASPLQSNSSGHTRCMSARNEQTDPLRRKCHMGEVRRLGSFELTDQGI